VGLPFLVPRILALMAVALGRHAEAERHFEQAIDVAASSGARLELASSHFDFARSLLRIGGPGSRDRAATHLTAALPLLREMNLRPFLSESVRLAQELGLSVDAGEAEGRTTFLEEAVHAQLRQGRTERAIAESMGLSLASVRSLRASGPAKPVPAPSVESQEPPELPVRRGQTTAVILFTDVVDSVQLTERLGDRASHELVQNLHDALKSIIVEHDGAVMPGTLLGDGLLATFASASQSLSAAVAIRPAAEALGVKLHIGVHAGDVIWNGQTISGGAVNIAARVRDACPPGEVLVSGTVRDLSACTRSVASPNSAVSMRSAKSRRRPCPTPTASRSARSRC
jgi:class 3 adenylate cyclase